MEQQSEWAGLGRLCSSFFVFCIWNLWPGTDTAEGREEPVSWFAICADGQGERPLVPPPKDAGCPPLSPMTMVGEECQFLFIGFMPLSQTPRLWIVTGRRSAGRMNKSHRSRLHLIRVPLWGTDAWELPTTSHCVNCRAMLAGRAAAKFRVPYKEDP